MEGRVRQALDTVLDPCSLGVGSPTSIVELGLVVDVGARAGAVRVVLCVTAPVCLMVAPIVEAVEEVVSATPGVTAIEVQVDPTVRWTASRMQPEHAHRLARARAEREGAGVRPQAWRSAASA